jgi:hypothetical protein
MRPLPKLEIDLTVLEGCERNEKPKIVAVKKPLASKVVQEALKLWGAILCAHSIWVGPSEGTLAAAVCFAGLFRGRDKFYEGVDVAAGAL